MERLYDAFVDAGRCAARWLPDAQLRERTATRPKSARFDWGDGDDAGARHVRREGRRQEHAALSHERLADADEAERMKAYWRERVAALKEVAGAMRARSRHRSAP